MAILPSPASMSCATASRPARIQTLISIPRTGTTVIKGVWYTGVGEKIDFNAAVPLKEGSYMLHPANGVHWDGAGAEEVVVQIIGVGPVTTTPVGAPDPQTSNWPKPK